MRALALACPLLIVMVVLTAQAGKVAADVSPTEGSLSIFGFYGDAVVSDDHKSADISESIFFNNSGSQHFSGNISLWIQKDAYVSSAYCGSQRNQILRVGADPTPKCYPLQPIDSENYKFKPFLAGEFLSYFGEKHTIGVNASSPNGSAQIDFSVTLGSNSVPSSRYLTVGEVNISTTSYELGARALLSWGPPRNLTVRQTLNLSNDGGNASTISFATLNVPTGWTATLWLGNTKVTSVQIPAGQYVNAVLNVTAPSYLLQAYVQYSLTGTDKPSGDFTLAITKEFPYNTTYVEFWIYALKGEEVAVTGDFSMAHGSVWNETAQRDIFPAYGFDINAGNTSTVVINWKPPPFEIPLFSLVMVILFAILLVAYFYVRKLPGKGFAAITRRIARRQAQGKRRAESSEVGEGEADDETEPAKTPPMTLAQLRDRRDLLRKSLDRLNQDEKDGITPKDIMARMKQEVETELSGIEQQLGILSTAAARKKAVLKALRNLERDHKEGKVDKELYDSLKARYEKEAISILKQIDQTKEKGADEIEEKA